MEGARVPAVSFLDDVKKVAGELWSVERELPAEHLLRWQDGYDDEVFHEHLETIRDYAHRDCERRMTPMVDSLWAAAEALMGPSRFAALQSHFEEQEDTLEAEVVAEAMMVEVESKPAGFVFTAGKKLLGRYTNYLEWVTVNTTDEWAVRAATSWLQFLPQEFGIRRYSDETDNQFIVRLSSMLDRVASWYPS